MCGYAGESEYNEEELKLIEFSDDNKTNSDEEGTNLNSNRAENLHWRFSTMPTFIECKCRKGFKDLLDDKPSGCVTNDEAFDTLILNKSGLEVTFIKHRPYKSNFTEA